MGLCEDDTAAEMRQMFGRTRVDSMEHVGRIGLVRPCWPSTRCVGGMRFASRKLRFVIQAGL